LEVSNPEGFAVGVFARTKASAGDCWNQATAASRAAVVLPITECVVDRLREAAISVDAGSMPASCASNDAAFTHSPAGRVCSLGLQNRTTGRRRAKRRRPSNGNARLQWVDSRF